MENVIELLSDSDEEVTEEVVPVAAAAAPIVVINTEDWTEVCIDGPPKTKPRPAFMSWMRGGHMFRRIVNVTRADELAFRNQFLENLRAQNNLSGPPQLPIFKKKDAVQLHVEFHRQLPLNQFVAEDRSRGLRSAHLYGTQPWDTKRPDVDNLAKLVMDALSGVLYPDDQQIVQILMTKTCDTRPPYAGKTIIRFKSTTNGYNL